MLFGRTIDVPTAQSREVVLARLSAAALSARAIAPLRPVRMSDWISLHEGKRFVGRLAGFRFKLVLLQTPGARMRQRGRVVVIVGSVEDHAVRARLRPPLFVFGFLTAFVVTVSAVLALSFFGPIKLPMVQVALALSMVLPVAVLVWFFRREAADAEQALRQTVLGA